MLAEEKLTATIERIPQDAFTVLDLIDVFKELYPEDWERLVERFGSPWIAVFKKRTSVREDER